jgi:hypothetical protein
MGHVQNAAPKRKRTMAATRLPRRIRFIVGGGKLPVLTGTTYKDLAIRDGATAASEFLRVTYAQEPPHDCASIRTQLLLYCERDTQAMIGVLEALRKLAKTSGSRPKTSLSRVLK